MPWELPEGRYLMKLGGSGRYGFRQMVDLLESENLKYKWREMRADYSAGFRMAPARNRLTYLRLNRAPSPKMRTTPFHYIKTPYRYTCEIKSYNKEYDRLETRYHTHSYRRLVTRGQAERTALRGYRKIPRRYRTKIFSVKLYQVEDKAKW